MPPGFAGISEQWTVCSEQSLLTVYCLLPTVYCKLTTGLKNAITGEPGDLISAATQKWISGCLAAGLHLPPAL